MIKQYDPNSLKYKNKIVVSSVGLHTLILKGKVFVKMKMYFVNESANNYEIEYQLPFFKEHNPTFLSVEFKEQEKSIFIKPTVQKSLVSFDDDVASDNFSIRLSHRDKNTTFLNLANFSPGSKATVTTSIEASLFDDGQNLCFEIPLFEKNDEFLYPDYSILIEILSQRISTKEIEFVYNRRRRQQDIKDITCIKANNVSFRSPLILRMRKSNLKPQIFSSLNCTPDILFFIDNDSLSFPNCISSIVNFIRNFSSNYQFNIIRYGTSSGLMSKTMISRKDFSSDQIEHFLSEKNKLPGPPSTFPYIYANNIGSYHVDAKSIFSTERNDKLRIEDVNGYKTVAICIGSVKDEEIIASKKVTTYVIDPILKHNSETFADRNGFHHIGQITNFKYGLSQQLNKVSQLIRTVPTDEISQEEEDDEEFVYNSIEKAKKMGLEQLFEYFISSGEIQHITLTRLEMIIDEVESYKLMPPNLIFDFLNKIGLKEKVDYGYLTEAVKGRPWLLQYLRQFVMVKSFGQKNPDSVYLNPLIYSLCDKTKSNEEKTKFLLSIQNSQFISFQLNVSLSKYPTQFKTNNVYPSPPQESTKFDSENYVNANQVSNQISYNPIGQYYNQNDRNKLNEQMKKILQKNAEINHEINQLKNSDNSKNSQKSSNNEKKDDHRHHHHDDNIKADHSKKFFKFAETGFTKDLHDWNILYYLKLAEELYPLYPKNKNENINSDSFMKRINFVSNVFNRCSKHHENIAENEHEKRKSDIGTFDDRINELPRKLVYLRKENEKKGKEYVLESFKNMKFIELRDCFSHLLDELENVRTVSESFRKNQRLINFPHIQQRLDQIDEIYINSIELNQEFEKSDKFKEKKNIFNKLNNNLRKINEIIEIVVNMFANNDYNNDGDDIEEEEEIIITTIEVNRELNLIVMISLLKVTGILYIHNFFFILNPAD